MIILVVDVSGREETEVEYIKLKHGSLLSWIDPDSSDQATWIHDYLSKASNRGLLVGYQAYVTGGMMLRTGIIDALRVDLKDANCREVIRSMRAAWHQKKYRERSGKQISFQLPDRLAAELDRVAKDRNKSTAETLRQIISDAARKNQRERHRSREKIKRLQENLKKLSEQKLKTEGIRNKIINALAEKLVEETRIRCCYESAVGCLTEAELNDSLHQDLLTAAIGELDKSIPEMRLLRSGIKPLKSYILPAEDQPTPK